MAIEWSIACLDPCVAPPHTLDFTAVVSGGASSFLVAWEFGDGSAPALGPSVEHTFPACGIYAISVVVTNGAATASNSMTVSSCPMV